MKLLLAQRLSLIASLSALLLLTAACTSREEVAGENARIPGTEYSVDTFVVGRTSALGGGTMEVCAQKINNHGCILLAKFNQEEVSHVHFVGHDILIDVLDTSAHDVQLTIQRFMGYNVRINPVPSF